MAKWGVFIIFLLFFCFGFLFVSSMPSPAATKVQEYIYSDMKSFFDGKAGPLSVAEIGGVEWDYICVAGYYSSGERVVEKDLSINTQGYRKSDEYFLDAENGLIFVSLKEKLLVTIRVDVNVIAEPVVRTSCRVASQAHLTKRLGVSNKEFILISSGGK